MYPLLDHPSGFPSALKNLSPSSLEQLAAEIRLFLLNTLDQTGGHLASNLGVVELSIALHHVFNTPYDQLVWDIGHQTYVHKILTNRKETLKNIRQYGGVSGFLKRYASDYDCFGAGHSSTSISAALGMSVANQIRDIKKQSVAIIGDAAIGAGMSFEALNHAGEMGANLLIILNDNKMSIAQNTGALNQHLTTLLTSQNVQAFKKRGQEFLIHFPKLYQAIKGSKLQLKHHHAPQSNFFQNLNIHYYGPVDGHNTVDLIKILNNLKHLTGPKLLHVVTQKGAGFKAAEKKPIHFHGVKTQFLTPSCVGSAHKNSPKTLTFSQVIGLWACQQAVSDKKLAVITPAMKDGSSLNEFAKQFPQQFFDVGIAEQHSLTFGAGLACGDLHPLVVIYSTFLQRAYDQLIHDVLLQKLPLILAIDRAGIVGEDGETHSGAYDLSFLRPLPNIVISAPCDGAELYMLLNSARQHRGCFAIRFPKDDAKCLSISDHSDTIAIGQACYVHQGEKVAVLNFGALLDRFKSWTIKRNFTLVNMRFIKPLDEKILHDIFAKHSIIITIEDNVLAGGANSAILEWYTQTNYKGHQIKSMSLPDEPIPTGFRQQLLDVFGMNTEKLQSLITKLISEQ